MASDEKGNGSARTLHRMTADYGRRAARAVNEILPERHRDKVLANLFGCSPRMVKYLRVGQHWTIDRLNQASAVLGAAFDVALAAGTDSEAAHAAEMIEIAARLARLEDRLDEVVSEVSAVVPSPSRAAADRTSREVPPTSREGKVAEIGSPSLRARR